MSQTKITTNVLADGAALSNINKESSISFTKNVSVTGNVSASGTITSSGNISGPNLVYTSGNQTISGDKTFSGVTTIGDLFTDDLNVGGITNTKGSVFISVGSEQNIGTYQPTHALEVRRSFASNNNMQVVAQFFRDADSGIGANGIGSLIDFRVRGGGGANDVRSVGQFGAFLGSTNDNQGFVIRTANTNRAIFTTTGNVGINTNSPSERLHVVGNGLFTGTLSAGTITSNGNTVATLVDPVRTTLSGDGIETTFNINGAQGLINASALIVAVDGILQEPNENYTVNDGVITFASPIPNGSKAVVISPTNIVQNSQTIPSDGSVTSEKLASDIEIGGQLTAPNQIASSGSSVITKNISDTERGVFVKRLKTEDTTRFSGDSLSDDNDFYIDIPTGGFWDITVIGVTSPNIQCLIAASNSDWQNGVQQGESRIGRLRVGSVQKVSAGYSNSTSVSDTNGGGFFWRFVHYSTIPSTLTVRWNVPASVSEGETTVYAGSMITARKLD